MLFFPTTLLCVDDTSFSFDAVSHALSATKHAFHLQDVRDSTQAVRELTLHNIHPFHRLSKEFDLKRDASFDYQKCDTDLFSVIKAFIQNPERYAHISAVLSDYEMPDVKGDVVLRQTPSHMYKLMLTEVMHYKRAIKSLNHGHIDWFLRKEDKKLNESLSHVLSRMFDRFFFEQQFYPQTTCSDLNNVVWGLARLHTMVEAYLIALNPSPIYLMIDAGAHEKIVHFCTPGQTLRNEDIERPGIGKKLAAEMRSGQKGYCSFHFDPTRQPKQAKESVYPLTVIDRENTVCEHMRQEELLRHPLPSGLSYHITEIGQNVYSKGSFKEFQRSREVGPTGSKS